MDAADALYGVPLDRFVAERAVLAKALRTRGDRERAAQVAKLAKPTVAAWVVNQLVRTHAEAVARLFDAGDAVKLAQQELVAGRGASQALRDASTAKRGALDELVQAAHELLDAHGYGHSDAMLARATATLDAAALEDDAREQVRSGCLTRELAHVGLGDGWAAAGPAPSRARAGRKRAATAPPNEAEGEALRADGEPLEAEGEALRADGEPLEAEGEALEAEARRRDAAQRAVRELDEARAHRDAVARELEEAQNHSDVAARDLERARRRCEAAARHLEHVKRRLENAAGALDAAQRALSHATAQAQPRAPARRAGHPPTARPQRR